MDRTEHVARLGVGAQACARTEREQLSALLRRRIGSEQDQVSCRVAAAQLPDLGELGHRADVENRHIGMVGAKEHGNARVPDVRGDDRETRIGLDQPAQTSGKEIIEAGNDNTDGSGKAIRTISTRCRASSPRSTCSSSTTTEAVHLDPPPPQSLTKVNAATPPSQQSPPETERFTRFSLM